MQMHKYRFFNWFYLLCLAVFPLHAAAKQYNLIAILTDDQAQWSVSCYGGENLQTPNIDRLAREGAKFENAYVSSPVCSPSRMTYFTGLYPTQTKVTDYLTPKQAQVVGINSTMLTWPGVLQKNGYTTGLIGKWHIGETEQSMPKNNGFDYFAGNLRGGWAPKKAPFVDIDGKPLGRKGFSVNVCTDLALDFLKKHKGDRFALLVHYREPHAAYVPMPQVDMKALQNLDPQIPNYQGLPEKKVKKLMRDYLTSVHAIDRSVGRILARVKALGLEDDTIVLFTSDHGYNVGHHGLRFKGNGYWLVKGKKGCRPNMFESSLTVPLIIKWPGVVKPGTQVKPMISNADFFPSILTMLGVPIPEKSGYQGRDFTPFLHGKTVEDWRDALFGQYQMVNNAKDSMRMVRSENWKLVRHYKVEGKDELYHLKNDPNESKNLFNNPEYQTIQKKLQERLNRYMKAIDDDPESKSPQSKTAVRQG
jgi:uncharacterized sulfatase